MRVATLLLLCLIGSIPASSILVGKTPVEIGQALGEIRRQKPAIQTASPAADYFESIKVNPFRRVNPLDYSQIEDVPRFISIQNRLGAVLEMTPVDTPQEIHRRMLFEQGTFSPDLLILDDFYPLRATEFKQFVPELSRLVFGHNGKEVDDVTEKSQIRLLYQTEPVSARFNPASIYGFPLGYSEFTGAIAFRTEVFPVYYNLLARQTWEFFRDLQRARESTGEESEEALILDDVDFKGFVQLAKTERLVFYYPDPKAPATRKEGLVFLNQLLFWLDKDLHARFLNEPRSSDVLKASVLIRDFLRNNAAIFKPLSSLDALLDAATQNNILANLPQGFDPENPAFDFQLPGTYDVLEQEHRLALAFIPESHVIPHFAKAAFEVRNAAILAEKEKARLAELAAKREREKLRRERMKRSKRGKDSEEDEQAEGQEDEEGQEAETTATAEEGAPPSWPRHTGQLTTHNLEKVATLRHYLAIPATSKKPVHGLYAIHSLLLNDVQRAMSILPAYWRPVKQNLYNADKDLEVFVLRLISTDDRETRKENQFFGIPFRFPHQEGLKKALPMLNSFYMRALEATIWDR